MPEWSKYRCEATPESGSTFDRVYHIAHVGDAQRILEDGKIKGGLVYDESKLRTARLAVSWLSANTWAFGSIYGTVGFVFDWKQLVAGRYMYWVEAITKYNPPAYRFLFTAKPMGDHSLVHPYDPTKDEGPVRLAGNEWYWNHNRTSEFLFEGDITIDQAFKVEFFRHHPEYCRFTGRAEQCADHGLVTFVGAARLLAHLMVRNIRTANHAIFGNGSPKASVAWFGVAQLISDLGENTQWIKSAGATEAHHVATLRAALSLYAQGDEDGARLVVARLGSMNVLFKLFYRTVSEHFGIGIDDLPGPDVLQWTS